jgi:hypothetical protein
MDASRNAFVIPPKSTKPCDSREACAILAWIPAFAGMTVVATVRHVALGVDQARHSVTVNRHAIRCEPRHTFA